MPENAPATVPDAVTPPTVTPPAVTSAPVPVPTPADPPAVTAETVTALTAERDSARTELKAAQDRLAAQEASMSEQNSAELQAKLKSAEDRAAALEGENSSLKLTQSLAGQVRNPAAAARLVDADLKKEDGTVDTAKFLERYPEFRPAETPATPGATAPDGGGGAQGGAASPDMAAAVRSGDPAAINAAMDAQLKRT